MTQSANAYGPVIGRWLAHRPKMPLDGGEPVTPDGDVTVEQAFAHTAVKDADMARAVLAGVYLAYNDLDRSHTLSQSIDTPTGSFWHGVMHRREGDFSNAKYWFRRVGSHPVYSQIHAAAAELAHTAPPHPSTQFLADQTQWDPFAFVDLVEQCVTGHSPVADLALTIQQCEGDLLFDLCYRAATGPAD